MNQVKKWLTRVCGGDSVNAIAGRIGKNQPTLDRQIKGNFPVETALDIAREYGYPAARALVDLGWLEPAEVRAVAGLEKLPLAEALAKADDADLLEEIGNRLDARGGNSRSKAEPDAGPNLPTLDEERERRRGQVGEIQKRAANPKRGKPKLGED